MLGPLCNQTVNKETDAKSLYYKNSASVKCKEQKRLKEICIFKQHPQKSLEQDILPKDRSFFASYGMCAMNYLVSLGIFMHQGHRMQR